MIASCFHGEDGLGDVLKEDPKDTSPLQAEHAVSAINRLAKEHKDELTVIATGPLTNLALALRYFAVDSYHPLLKFDSKNCALFFLF